MDKTKHINISVNHGQAFFSDSITVADNVERFVFDFKQTTPRFDPTTLEQPEQQTSINLQHNAVVVSAVLAKVFYEMLGERIKQHEKMYGVIKKPSQKSQEKGFKESATIKPSYFG
jgi:hypothetical protein